MSKTLIWPFTISPNGDGDDDETACRRSESSEFLQYSSIATRKHAYAKLNDEIRTFPRQRWFLINLYFDVDLIARTL